MKNNKKEWEIEMASFGVFIKQCSPKQLQPIGQQKVFLSLLN